MMPSVTTNTVFLPRRSPEIAEYDSARAPRNIQTLRGPVLSIPYHVGLFFGNHRLRDIRFGIRYQVFAAVTLMGWTSVLREKRSVDDTA
jgi:hypothetical protein